MRILEIETFGRGGLAHYTYNLSCALAERGHEVTVLTAAEYELADYEPSDRPRPGGLRVVQRIAVRGRWKKVRAVLHAFRSALFARRLRPDVVHVHCTNPIALLYHLLLRLLGLPLVSTVHQVTPHEPHLFQTAVWWSIHRSCRRLIAHSEVDRRRLHAEFGVDPERVAVIPHGEYGFFDQVEVDRQSARRDLGLEFHLPVALFFGYLREYKGLDLLLAAWPKVQAAIPAARLVVAGDPVQLPPRRREELRSWAERLGAVHRLEYIPFDEVHHYFAAADALVLPYRKISQSGVLLLALALGVPVVATRVGAWPEMLTDGENALLVPPEDSRELATALIRLLGDPALRQRLARGGKALAETLGWPAIAERTEAVFGELRR